MLFVERSISGDNKHYNDEDYVITNVEFEWDAPEQTLEDFIWCNMKLSHEEMDKAVLEFEPYELPNRDPNSEYGKGFQCKKYGVRLFLGGVDLGVMNNMPQYVI